MKDNYKIDDLVACYVGDCAVTNKTVRRSFIGPSVQIKNLINREGMITHVDVLKKYYEKPSIEIRNSERAKLLAQVKSNK